MEPELFLIDTGCSGTIKKCETFVLETIEKRLGNDQSWSDLVRLRKKTHRITVYMIRHCLADTTTKPKYFIANVTTE